MLSHGGESKRKLPTNYLAATHTHTCLCLPTLSALVLFSMSGDDALARIDDDEDDEGQSVTIDPRTCVIFGLQSDAGKDLNGQMGMVEDSIEVIQTAKPEDRLPVRLMRGEKKAVRRKNLELICMKRDSSGVGVSTVVLNPFGPGSYISYSRFGHSGPTQEKMEDALSKPEVLRFERVDELPVPLNSYFSAAPGPICSARRRPCKR